MSQSEDEGNNMIIADSSDDDVPIPNESNNCNNKFRKLFVDKLTTDITEKDLYKTFKKYGIIEKITKYHNRKIPNKYFAYILYKYSNDCIAASYNPSPIICGHQCAVILAAINGKQYSAYKFDIKSTPAVSTDMNSINELINLSDKEFNDTLNNSKSSGIATDNEPCCPPNTPSSKFKSISTQTNFKFNNHINSASEYVNISSIKYINEYTSRITLEIKCNKYKNVINIDIDYDNEYDTHLLVNNLNLPFNFVDLIENAINNQIPNTKCTHNDNIFNDLSMFVGITVMVVVIGMICAAVVGMVKPNRRVSVVPGSNDVYYDLLWINNGVRNRFETNNLTVHVNKYSDVSANGHELYSTSPTKSFYNEYNSWSDDMIKYLIDEDIVNEKDIALWLFKDKQSGHTETGYYTDYKRKRCSSKQRYDCMIVTLFGEIIDANIGSIHTLFDFIITAKESNILVNLNELRFISYYINDTIYETFTVHDINIGLYGLAAAEYGALNSSYMITSVNGDIHSARFNQLNRKQKSDFFNYWNILNDKLKNIQNAFDKFGQKLKVFKFNHNDNDVPVLLWFKTKLLNDKQIDNKYVNLLMHYLYFDYNEFGEIQTSYDMVIFREQLLNINDNESIFNRNLFISKMNLKNVNEMNVFINSILIYLYELPNWIIGKYKCNKYSETIHENDYHFVEILHDRTNIGNYIWKTKIGQIWSLNQIDNYLSTFNIGKESIYYNYNGYKQMMFGIDTTNKQIIYAIGQEWERYDKV